MKKLLVGFALINSFMFSTLAFADGDVVTQPADKEFVQETYDYCVSMQTSEEIDKQSLLECLNSELEYYEYTGFASIEQALSFAKVADDESK
ncbi:hypothetical protein KO525_19010 [Psychrosphaera sp. B3R10]|uniref:Uncharacterized protein n=1 Tax=Psychrosphaera algicola TaxID=3023714 RepID=A0ABT5FHP1_9GAMM|nr:MULTISPECIES: hypothetical protein [unclassified Psychrosphaera]MBU2880776.1 hypothetical protein [Psychrosphaera sp. I2R16]MBU2991478.1 hypothetical protein [Psychrosphaera sp. B3R10]MDC2890714.1 hypothetical protein [Psychrosphaera sp. G1-22]MDO6719370.1 hypothetical protein [Psychrosphaera sp. 1_MG-2023]